jgi:hypothetical protein
LPCVCHYVDSESLEAAVGGIVTVLGGEEVQQMLVKAAGHVLVFCSSKKVSSAAQHCVIELVFVCYIVSTAFKGRPTPRE